MDDYMSARRDLIFTGYDRALRSTRLLRQTAALYPCDMFIGSTLQVAWPGNSFTVTAGGVAGPGGAPI